MKILPQNNFSKKNFLIKKTILITAGGTGGHIFPAECLAWEFNKIGWDIVFISDKRGSKFVKNLPSDIKIFIQDVVSLNFRNPFKLLHSIYMLLKGFFYSSFLLFIYRPCVVVGFGGYPTFPTILAAKIFHFKVSLPQN